MEQPKQPTRKQRQKDAQKPQQGLNNDNNNGTERLKTVVRRLPPNLPEEIFWQSVETWVTEETATWKVFCPGKLKKRMNKESVPSRAYIAFKNEEALAMFSREYDGHIFRDKSGNESHAIVEFAPFQKIPVERRKPDIRINTIDKDEDYISFLESLKKSEKPEPVSLEALVAAAQPAPPPTTTPLLEALKAEKLAQKDRETILRSHAHYKESAIAAKKEEAKKKAIIAAQSQLAAQATGAAHKSANEGGGMSQSPSKKSKKAAAAAQKAAAQETQPPVRIAAKPPPPVASTAATPNVAPAPPVATQRSQRDRPPKRQRTAAILSAPSEAAGPVPPIPAPAPLATEGGASATPSVTSTATQSRRGRPVVGIGRHFEAALNGAVGVGERKRRSEKEKEKEKEKEVDPVSSTTGGAAEGKNLTVSPVTGPTSSAGTGASKRKDRHPSGGKPKEAKSTTGGTSILQRGEASDPLGEGAILQRPDTQTGPQADTSSGRGGGGGKRGGRGRGRGTHRGG
ncbi:Smg-4/UPF3 family-domain-containing protein [Pisolithus marmoratus]|nr:Smg-4/UPF3 family-domain-containing protein [Pisolithus marmoratus]